MFIGNQRPPFAGTMPREWTFTLGSSDAFHISAHPEAGVVKIQIHYLKTLTGKPLDLEVINSTGKILGSIHYILGNDFAGNGPLNVENWRYDKMQIKTIRTQEAFQVVARGKVLATNIYAF